MRTASLVRENEQPPITPTIVAPARNDAWRELPERHHLGAASLFTDPAATRLATGVTRWLREVGVHVDLDPIAPALARSGTVGRIGVPLEASARVLAHRAAIGGFHGADPLAPVTRLWRGLQRRADVQFDLRVCLTLPGSDADRHGNQRDVLLFSQRLVDRSGHAAGVADASAQQWARARQAAEFAYRIATEERRTLLLVVPVGRGTAAQRHFADAVVRTARQHRMPSPRMVKAGLLSALLCGDSGRERWLVTSVMPIEELSATTDQAIGSTGPWPVISIGTEATFYDMPVLTETGHGDPVPLLLVAVAMLNRGGRPELAHALLQSVRVTTEAAARMQEELGGSLDVPLDAFLSGVCVNWGRTPITMPVGDGRRIECVPATQSVAHYADRAGDAVA